MAAEDFFARWSRKKTEAQPAPADAAAQEICRPQSSLPAPANGEQRLPTLEDVAQLTPQADFSAFMTQGVDEGVKRAAMKKLFSDPHFNVMDGLDVYIDDYNSFEALTPDVIATLNHAKALLDPLSQCSAPTMRLLDALGEDAHPATQAEADEAQTEEQKRIADTSAATPADASAAQPETIAGNTDPEANEPDASHTQP
jgi:hypothetical protein